MRWRSCDRTATRTVHGDSVPVPSSLLVLRRNEPVRITIVNHLRAATGVHWHGIEVPAYSDGVPGWSGSGGSRSRR